MTVLSDAPAGASFRVKNIHLSKEVGRRLADMGFIEGTEGAVVRSGFFYGPLQIRIRGYDVLIRRSEAAGIEVEPVGDWSAARDARGGHGHRWRGFMHGGRGFGFGGRGRFGRRGFTEGEAE
jgi:ferrous iron transport protein A